MQLDSTHFKPPADKLHSFWLLLTHLYRNVHDKRVTKHILIVNRFSQELLSCILEVVDVPILSKKSLIVEDHFRLILEWCDFWIILLATTGNNYSKQR